MRRHLSRPLLAGDERAKLGALAWQWRHRAPHLGYRLPSCARAREKAASRRRRNVCKYVGGVSVFDLISCIWRH